jgi:hypothetical protein
MNQYSLFEAPNNDQADAGLDGSMTPWLKNYGALGEFQYRPANHVPLSEGQRLVASTIFSRTIKLPESVAADYNLRLVNKTLSEFRVSVVENPNKTSFAKCEYMESWESESAKNFVAHFKEVPMHLLESSILEPVYEFSRTFWEKYRPVERPVSLIYEQPKVRHADLEEKILSERLQSVRNLNGKETGWKVIERCNLGNQLLSVKLISVDGKYAVDFTNSIPSSGTESVRTKAYAQAYAIDHMYVAVTKEHEHAGFHIYPLWMKTGELKYAVQTIDNFRKGRDSGFGDSIFITVEDAQKQAAEQKNTLESILVQEEKDIEISIEENARKLANSLLSLPERRANSVLDKAENYLNIGLLNGSRRESMELAVTKGCEFAVKSIRDDASKNSDLKVMDRVLKSGYMLGLSNSNIPLVKEGLAAQQRLKENNYVKPEYRLYRTSQEDGLYREITKTEFDYANKFTEMSIADKEATQSIVRKSGQSR